MAISSPTPIDTKLTKKWLFIFSTKKLLLRSFILLFSIRKVINFRFPDLFFKFNDLTDSRKRKEYSMAEIIIESLFMYIFKETSRNAYNNNRRKDGFRENVLKYFGFNLPHTDTSDEVLRELQPDELEPLKAHLVSGLIEQKFLRKFRFLNICQKNNWQFIITLKDANLKTFQEEVGLLKATVKK